MNDENKGFDGPKGLRNEYVSRINRVQDYIESHLDEDLNLNTLAKIAHFSPFHFHRIYTGMTGETLNQFIQRLRIETAANQLLRYPESPITEIALDCGFSSSAAFARVFKEFFGISASEWRESAKDPESKIRKLKSKHSKQHDKIRKDYDKSSFYLDGETNNQVWRIIMSEPKQIETKVEVKELPEITVAYIRHVGPYAGDTKLFEGLFTKLMTWAGSRQLLNFPKTQCISIYHDNPSITDDDKLRLDVCISVEQDTEVDGEVGKATIPAGTYAVANFEIDASQYGDAWSTVYGGWLPDSGYQPGDGPCYEIYLNDPKQHPEGKHIVNIVVPVKPM